MGADAGAEQLVGAEAQHVEDRRVELFQRAVAARGEHRVVRAPAAQGAVGQLGRERGRRGRRAAGPRGAWAAAGWRTPRGRGPRRARRRRCGAGGRGARSRPGRRWLAAPDPPGPLGLRPSGASASRPPSRRPIRPLTVDRHKALTPATAPGRPGLGRPADRNRRALTSATARGRRLFCAVLPWGGDGGAEALPCSGGVLGGVIPPGKNGGPSLRRACGACPGAGRRRAGQGRCRCRRRRHSCRRAAPRRPGRGRPAPRRPPETSPAPAARVTGQSFRRPASNSVQAPGSGVQRAPGGRSGGRAASSPPGRRPG